MKHIVYRCDIRDRADTVVPSTEPWLPVVIESPLDALGQSGSLLRMTGVVPALRLMLRLCRHGRLFYYAADQGNWIHWGGITQGWCRYYRVGERAAVFGPVETAMAFRGRGVAPAVMRGAMRVLAGRGVHVFYVDTSELNLPMQHAASKAGFRDTGLRFDR